MDGSSKARRLGGEWLTRLAGPRKFLRARRRQAASVDTWEGGAEVPHGCIGDRWQVHTSAPRDKANTLIWDATSERRPPTQPTSLPWHLAILKGRTGSPNAISSNIVCAKAVQAVQFQ